MMVKSVPEKNKAVGNEHSYDLALERESWGAERDEDVRFEELVETAVELTPSLILFGLKKRIKLD